MLDSRRRLKDMEHGRANSVGLPVGLGTYVVHIAFEMPGQWRIPLTVATPGATGTVNAEVDEFP